MTTAGIIDQTKQLMAIPSTSDNSKALKDAVIFVENIVTSSAPGITIERFERNGKPSFLAYKGDKRPETFDIICNAHVDVVPGDPDLFKAYEKDGKLYGRGALDMKGTALVMADVFCELVSDLPYSLGLQIVSDEEIGGYDGAKLQIENGVHARFVLLGEYANARNTIAIGARGVCWTEIAFKGQTSHGGHLWHGANAVVMASEFANAILKRFPVPDTETWITTANISSITTPNESFNKVPDAALLRIDFRFTPDNPIFRNKESVEAFIHSVDPSATLINLPIFEQAVQVEEQNAYVQGLSQALEQITGEKARYVRRPGASDGRHYALANIDSIEFGLCGKHSHATEEYVELSSFDEYRKVLRAFLRNPLPERL